jgi:hypothetical protein
MSYVARLGLGGVLGLTGKNLSSVELKLLTLEDVTVTSARLSRSGRDHGEDLTGLELLSEL